MTMIAFGHSAVGSIIGIISYQSFQDLGTTTGLAGAVSAGVVSHYLADAIPHGHFFNLHEYKSKIVYALIFDLFLSFALYPIASYLLNGNLERALYITAAMIGAHLPDILDGFINIGFLPKKSLFKLEYNFHQLVHWHGRGENVLLIGIYDIWQLALIILALALILML